MKSETRATGWRGWGGINLTASAAALLPAAGVFCRRPSGTRPGRRWFGPRDGRDGYATGFEAQARPRRGGPSEHRCRPPPVRRNESLPGIDCKCSHTRRWNAVARISNGKYGRATPLHSLQKSPDVLIERVPPEQFPRARTHCAVRAIDHHRARRSGWSTLRDRLRHQHAPDGRIGQRVPNGETGSALDVARWRHASCAEVFSYNRLLEP